MYITRSYRPTNTTFGYFKRVALKETRESSIISDVWIYYCPYSSLSAGFPDLQDGGKWGIISNVLVMFQLVLAPVCYAKRRVNWSLPSKFLEVFLMKHFIFLRFSLYIHILEYWILAKPTVFFSCMQVHIHNSSLHAYTNISNGAERLNTNYRTYFSVFKG